MKISDFRKNRKAGKRKIKSFSYFSNFVFVFILILSSGIYFYQDTKKDQNSDIIFLESTQDEMSLLDKMKEKGLIKNNLTYNTIKFVSNTKDRLELLGVNFSDKFNLANIATTISDPEYKYVSIQEGLRKEEIADDLQAELEWSDDKVKSLKQSFAVCDYSSREGYLSPGDYLIKSTSEFNLVKNGMQDRFNENYSELAEKYKNNYTLQNFNKDDIVTVASLIQREAAGKKDARIISGIIWNRIEVGMPLQIDATLQYVKGHEDLWWPVPKSEDKYLESPYNTYQHDGLPPAPIANPGLASLEAAMNPVKTSCMFYLHDRNRNIHCSSTYKGHLQNIDWYL